MTYAAELCFYAVAPALANETSFLVIRTRFDQSTSSSFGRNPLVYMRTGKRYWRPVVSVGGLGVEACIGRADWRRSRRLGRSVVSRSGALGRGE